MRRDGAIPLVVQSPSGRVALIVDSTLPLETLAAALMAATGMPPGDRQGEFWEGQRRLDQTRSLRELGVVAGSEIRLELPSGGVA